jgi:hypothetical protein
MKIFAAAMLLVTVQIVIPMETHAGPYTDALSKCLVDSTSKRDREDLVRWMFSAASLHPAVAPISVVSDEQLDSVNKVIADLVVRLLTETCRPETEEALLYEGKSTIEASFAVLGQVAGQELFSSVEVSAGLAGLEKHMDKEKLGSLKGIE